MICPDTRIQRERMADIPLLNPALEVQAVGFSVWEAYCLGVLITPWFMNLMLLPLAGDKLVLGFHARFH